MHVRHLYSYYDLEGSPCRISESTEAQPAIAEIYKPGTGFLPASKTDILYNAQPISQREFDAMILAVLRANKTE